MNGKRKVPTLRKRAVNTSNKTENTSNNTVSDGQPIEYDMSLIDLDPNQPRDEYDEDFLKELSEAIKRRGVRSPISIREDPDNPERFIVNHGHCRYLSSEMAGKTTIPAFIDNDHDEDDQVIENIQRDNLKPRQIAKYIGKKKAQGLKHKEIAEIVSKSDAWVSQHANLLTLPEPIAVIFDDDTCSDVTVLSELSKAYKKNPEEVTDWIEEEDQEFTRPSVKLLREFIEDKNEYKEENSEPEENSTSETEDDTGGEDNTKEEKKEPDPDKLKKAIVLVTHDNRQARMMLNRRPSADGWAWLKYEDDGEEFESDLGEVALMSIMEG